MSDMDMLVCACVIVIQYSYTVQLYMLFGMAAVCLLIYVHFGI